VLPGDNGGALRTAIVQIGQLQMIETQ
jgi:hypothetical protein